MATALLQSASAEAMESGRVGVEHTYIRDDALAKAFESRRTRGQPSLMWSLLDFDGCRLVYAGVLNLVAMLCSFIPPMQLKHILSDGRLEARVLSASVFVVACLLQAISSHQFILEASRLGIRAQGATTCMLYDKALRLCQPAAASYNSGSMAKIMEVGAKRLSHYYTQLVYVVSMPLMLLIGVALLYCRLGLATAMPLLFTLPMSRLCEKLASQSAAIKQQVKVTSSNRVKLLEEVVQSTKLIKMYAWEAYIHDMLASERVKELGRLSHLMIIRMWAAFVDHGVPMLLPLATFGMHIIFGGELDIGDVFSILALLDLIRAPINVFPHALASVRESQVGINRVERFLCAKEVDVARNSGDEFDGPTTKPSYRRSLLPGRFAVSMVGAMFQWPSETREVVVARAASFSRRALRLGPRRTTLSSAQVDEERGTGIVTVPVPFTIRASALHIAPGQLAVIMGAAGAGKSSLLAAILNEATQVAGRVEVTGSVSYCPQAPWLLHGSIVDNITLGSAVDNVRLAACINACSLAGDLEQLEDGAATIVGEGGVELSAGQKAKIGLARTAYATASIYILDDPLADMDAQAGTRLLENCFSANSHLRHSTRVLVTNQLQLMKAADIVIVVSDGNVVAARPPGDISLAELQAYGVFQADSPPGTSSSSSTCPPAQPRMLPSVPPMAVEISGQRPDARELDASEEDEERIEASRGVTADTWLLYGRTAGVRLLVVWMASCVVEKVLLVCGTAWWAARMNDLVGDNVWLSLSTFALFIIGALLALGLRLYISRRVAHDVSKRVHDKPLWAVLRSETCWLEGIQPCQIVANFSKHLNCMDVNLMETCSRFAESTFNTVASCVFVLSVMPILFLVLAPMGIAFCWAHKKYRVSGRGLHRMMMQALGPLRRGLDDAIQGAPTIRAFGRWESFSALNSQRTAAVMHLMSFRLSRDGALRIRLRLIVVACVAPSVFYVALQDHVGPFGFKMPGVVAGLVLRYAAVAVTSLEKLVLALAETENPLMAFSQLSAFAEARQEDELQRVSDAQIDPCPPNGVIEFTCVFMRHIDPPLRDVSLLIAGGSHTGFVSRNGCAKQSLVEALFRLREIRSGKILIDGVDISAFGVHKLRKLVSIIPEEPMIFSGSLRFNLAPCGSSEDQAMWDVLDRLGLADFFRATNEGLDYRLPAGGGNLSFGQRRLVCAARAFLRRARILIIEETRAADEINDVIKVAVRQLNSPKKLTSVTFSHRVKRVLDMQTIYVMDSGWLAEAGPPHALVRNTAGLFFRMCVAQGILIEAQAIAVPPARSQAKKSDRFRRASPT